MSVQVVEVKKEGAAAEVPAGLPSGEEAAVLRPKAAPAEEEMEVKVEVKAEIKAEDAEEAKVEVKEEEEESVPASSSFPPSTAAVRPAPVILKKGTRISVLWEDETPPTWFEGTVHAYNPTKDQHRIFYADGDRKWEDLATVSWTVLEAAPPRGDHGGSSSAAASSSSQGSGGTALAAATRRRREEDEDAVIAVPSEAQAGVRLTRSKRRGVKLAEEDVVDGLVRCPGCGMGIQMADGGCNVTTCYNARAHGGRYYYFCAHCRVECPDGESMCASCPSHNDRQTRMRLQARKDSARQAFLASNSRDNPCEIDSD